MTATATERPARSRTKERDQERKKEILAAIDAFEKCRLEYAEKPGEDPPGRHPFWTSLVGIIHAFNAGPIPPQFGEALVCVENLAERLVSLAQDRIIDFEQLTPDFCFKYYESIQQVMDRHTHPEKRIESVKELLEQKVSVAQIAKMTGLSEADVYKEEDTPGSVCVPGWVPPILKQTENKFEKASRLSTGVVLSACANKLAELGFPPPEDD